MRENVMEALREMTADRDYWMRKAKALEIAHDRLADRLEAVKEALKCEKTGFAP